MLRQLNTIHILIWIAVLFAVSRVFRVQREEYIDGKLVWRYEPWFAAAAFIPVFLMAAFGQKHADVLLYMAGYHSLPSTLHDGWTMIKTSEYPGFLLFQIIVRQLSGGSERVCRAAIAFVHVLPIMLVLRRYSDDFLLSYFIFISSCLHLSWMMNGIRQFMAVTIIFGATPWIIQKKYFRVILVILIASTFHRTALFMIPVIFFAQGETWDWKTIIFSAFAIIMAYLFSRNISLFDNFANSVGYSIEYARQGGDDGANPLRVLINSLPMIISFLIRYKIRNENNPVIKVCTNMSVITAGTYLVAMVTSGIMTGRMPIYTSLYNLILLPHVLRSLFTEKYISVITAVTVVFYLLYCMVEIA